MLIAVSFLTIALCKCTKVLTLMLHKWCAAHNYWNQCLKSLVIICQVCLVLCFGLGGRYVCEKYIYIYTIGVLCLLLFVGFVSAFK